MECKPVSVCQSDSCNHHRISSTYIAIPLIVFGMFSNILCILVWKKLMSRARKRNITCGIYLMAIAVVDSGMLLSFFFVDSFTYLIDSPFSHHSYNVFYTYIAFPAFMFFVFLSFWLIAGVDTCRMTMVFFPFKMRQSATRLTNTAIVAIIIFCFGVNVPNFISFIPVKANNTACLHETELYGKHSFFLYRFYFQCIFLTVFPWCVIVLVNFFMLLKHFSRKRFDGIVLKRGKEMGNLLHVISIWFVVILFWQCMTQCFYITGTDQDSQWPNINSAFAFAKLGILLNSSPKVIIYVIASSTFRRELLELLTAIKHTSYKNKASSSITDLTKTTRRPKRLNAIAPVNTTPKLHGNTSSHSLNQSRISNLHTYRDTGSIQLAF